MMSVISYAYHFWNTNMTSYGRKRGSSGLVATPSMPDAENKNYVRVLLSPCSRPVIIYLGAWSHRIVFVNYQVTYSIGRELVHFAEINAGFIKQADKRPRDNNTVWYRAES